MTIIPCAIIFSTLIAVTLPMAPGPSSVSPDNAHGTAAGQEQVQLPWMVSLGVRKGRSHRHICTGSFAKIMAQVSDKTKRLVLTTAECAKKILPLIESGKAQAVLQGKSDPISIVVAFPQPYYIGIEEMIRLVKNRVSTLRQQQQEGALLRLVDIGLVELNEQLDDRQPITFLDQADNSSSFTGHWGKDLSAVENRAEILTSEACEEEMARNCDHTKELKYCISSANVGVGITICVRSPAVKTGTPLYLHDGRQHRLLGMFSYSIGNELSAYVNVTHITTCMVTFELAQQVVQAMD